MKRLVAVVCVIALAGAAFFFWGEYNEAQKQIERAGRIERARKVRPTPR
jgi:hypothetical protein